VSRLSLHWIEPGSSHDNFPPIEAALRYPDGLLCLGGDLGAKRLLSAYKRGIFPWYSEGQPIMWWSPSPRCVLLPGEFKTSRSLKKTCRNAGFEFALDNDFTGVIESCAEPRNGDSGTWITADMMLEYKHLHILGHAHSAEVWRGGRLVGGLYGITIGQVFFGESMFSKVRDGSKVALACLANHLLNNNFQLIDCQVSSAHLLTLGAREITREDFQSRLREYCDLENSVRVWHIKPMPVNSFLHLP